MSVSIEIHAFILIPPIPILYPKACSLSIFLTTFSNSEKSGFRFHQCICLSAPWEEIVKAVSKLLIHTTGKTNLPD